MNNTVGILQDYITQRRKAGCPLELDTITQATGWTLPQLFRALQNELTPQRNEPGRQSAGYRERPAHTPRELQAQQDADAAPVITVVDRDVESRLLLLCDAIGTRRR